MMSLYAERQKAKFVRNEFMKVLITGSNGFIGSHVAAHLKKKGIYVIGLDRGDAPRSEVDEYIACDLFTAEVANIPSKTKAGTPDAIIHLAADMRKEPYTLDVISNNCVGTQRLLELCRDAGIRRFAQLSSLPVIGYPRETPITENHTLRPPTVYHCTKHMQELLASYASDAYGVQCVSFRISAPVGPRMNEKTILPVFVKRALAGEDITLLGEGLRRQTYVHVSDIAEALFLAITVDTASGVYNLASYNRVSNRELAELCIKLTGSSSKILFSGTEDPADAHDWNISLAKIEKDLGYTPKVDITDMILEMKDYFTNM